MSINCFTDRWDEPFRTSAFRLRFELGGEVFGNDAPVPRFVQALDRARQIACDVFERSNSLFGIVAASADSAHDLFAPTKDAFGVLHASGFCLPHVAEWQASLWPDENVEDEQTLSSWRAFDLIGHVAVRDVLLWCAIAYEMPIAPKTPVLSYLVDFERGILLHAYDDRGMDVTSLEPGPLLPVYRGRSAWLLGYDRARMAAAFDGAEAS